MPPFLSTLSPSIFNISLRSLFLKGLTLEDTRLVPKAMEKQLCIKTTWENRPEGYPILYIAPESRLRLKQMRLHFRHPMYLYML